MVWSFCTSFQSARRLLARDVHQHALLRATCTPQPQNKNCKSKTHPSRFNKELMCAEGTVVESLNERTMYPKRSRMTNTRMSAIRPDDTAPHFCRDLKKRITVVVSQLNRHPMEAALTRMVSFEIRLKLTTRKESHGSQLCGFSSKVSSRATSRKPCTHPPGHDGHWALSVSDLRT